MTAPWWALSPNPISLAVFGCCAYYGTRHLAYHTKRQWIANFAEATLILGIVFLPHDSAWQILQWLKWGYLYPNEWIMVINILIRNALMFTLCLLSGWKLADRTKQLQLHRIIYVLIPIAVLLIKFMMVNEIVWTDWTYGIRFQPDSPWLLAYASGLIDKATLSGVYVTLWQK